MWILESVEVFGKSWDSLVITVQERPLSIYLDLQIDSKDRAVEVHFITLFQEMLLLIIGAIM